MSNGFREFRKSLKKTQKEMADVLGVPQVTYSNWENGIRKVPVEIMRKLYDLGFDLNKLVGGNGRPHEPEINESRLKARLVIDDLARTDPRLSAPADRERLEEAMVRIIEEDHRQSMSLEGLIAVARGLIAVVVERNNE